jgi:endonuclease YncB( thermonuclease family)
MKKFVALLVFLIPGLSLADEMTGTGQYVKDGDTFDLVMPSHKVTIRICGIDAPESGEPGSREAWAGLSDLVHGKPVTCIQVNSKPRGTVCDHRSQPTNRDRIVAQCFVNGLDVGGEMVRRNLACSWTRFDGGYYQREFSGKACTRN